ncbi:Carbohydrate ABC transporter substrate-binding protein, CUT1 family [Arthrobacter sp. 9V]|uniref:ABC transporter substrate-binding protein n=1 Tax=Arthrobacter sp. 9V TaxID=2653132 RepID=UPI0012F1359D|nr:extracellular solute-binding protein [Arthrobacter sp. 9V]VXB49025.1 Carbohydrate ABC transporter substrate-binding protein, CUT1 family [Arthrobacter sp. 9V]
MRLESTDRYGEQDNDVMKGPTMKNAPSPAGRRFLSVAALASVTALALSACGGGDANSNAPIAEETGPVEITLATPAFTGGGAGNPYLTLIDAFKAKNPNITVKLVESPNDQHGQTMRTQLQAGNAPDIFYVTAGRGNNQSFASLAEAGYLQDLTDQKWAADAIPASAKNLYYDEDKVFAVPADLAPITMLQNTGVLKELGLQEPATLDELITQCKTVRAAGKSYFAVAGTSGANTGLQAMQLSASLVYAKDPQWDAKRAKKETTFADSDWKKVLEQIVKFKDAGCYQDGAAGAGFDQLFPSVAQGKVAAAFAPAGAVAALRAQVKDGSFDVAVLPGEKAEDTRLIASPGNALAVNAASKHKGSTLKFLEFLAQPANQDALAKANGNVSVTSAISSTVPEQFPSLEPYFSEPEKKIVSQPNYLWPNSGVYDSLGTGIQGLLTGQATPDQVLKTMDEQYDRGA